MKKEALFDIAAYSALLKSSDAKDELETAIDQALEGQVPPPLRKKKAPVVQDKGHDHDHEDSIVTSPYGKRVHPITGIESFHSGIDLRAPEGTEILAWDDGKVVKVGSDSRSGNYIILKHADGFKTSYSHLSKVLISQGNSVTQGQVIGLTGSTGSSTGDHLHFRMKVFNKDVNPAEYLSGNPVLGGVRNG